MDIVSTSYKNLRRAIGVIALVFPFILILFRIMDGPWTETSISAMYWTNSGVLFSALLIMLSTFLFSYSGYDKTDKVLTSVSAVALLFVVLFPCEGGTKYLIPFIGPPATRVLHYISAGVTFSMLGIMSLFQFTKYSYSKTENKVKRNLVYRVCGIVIFASIVAMLLVELIPSVRTFTDGIKLFYWLESLVVIAFGFSWLTKGEFILKD